MADVIYGCEVPRIYTKPLRELTPETTAGFSVIEFADKVLNVQLFPWQRWLLIHALETLDDGTFRFRYVTVLVARQNGKSLVSIVLALWAMFVRQVSLIVGTAQSLDIAEEIWQGVVDVVEGIPELNDEVEQVCRVNGKKSLSLISGSRYKIAAASRKGGRGLSADLILLDELREQTNFDAWGAVTKTMLARPNAFVWGMSNAGDNQSVVLRHLRKLGHAALGFPDGYITDGLEEEDDTEEKAIAKAKEADSMALFEWSAAPGDDPSLPETWAKANPSLGYIISDKSLRSSFETDPKDVFLTECLCQWVTAAVFHPFPQDAWESGIDENSEIKEGNKLYFGLDVSSDRKYASLAVCGKRRDGRYHVEVIAYRRGVRWLRNFIVNHLIADSSSGTIEIAVQGRGCPAASLIDSLETIKGCNVHEITGRDVAGCCGYPCSYML